MLIQDAKCACCRPAVTVTAIGEAIPDFLMRGERLYIQEGAGYQIDLKTTPRAPEEPKQYPFAIDFPESPADARVREQILTNKVLRDTAKKERRHVDTTDYVKLGYTWGPVSVPGRKGLKRWSWVPPININSLGLDYVNPTRRAQGMAANRANSERARERFRLRSGDTDFFGGGQRDSGPERE